MINLVFDAGHGQGRAHNRGYVGKRWKNEGDGNYYFSNMVRDRVNSYDGIHAWRTRPKISQNPSLSSRAKYRSDKRGFFSWHTNAFGRNQASGVEIFFWNQSKLNQGRDLGNRLLNVISKTLKIPNRGLKIYPFAVLNTNHNKARESMLIEVCFHDNEKDVAKYEAQAEDLAVKLADEIVAYYGIKKKPEPVTPKLQANQVNQGGMTMLGRKPVAIISILSEGDYKGAEVIRDWLYPSYNPVITQSGKFNYAGINTNYIIAVGGTKGNHTGYANYLISGKNRQETYDKCLEFVNGGSKGREKFKI